MGRTGGLDMATAPDLEPLLLCPRCRAALSLHEDEAYSCSNADCLYHAERFPMVDGTPALIDFAHSIISREAFEGRRGVSDINRSNMANKLLRGAVYGDNPIAVQNGVDFVEALRKIAAKPRVLIVGGGERGAGTTALYEAKDIRVVGTDVYASEVVDIIADAHRLPFPDASFDGVWIQAVLEHVLDPHQVVAEIHRILRPEGLVYAETPFMQQVHEGPYDFMRFSRSGHRWLFRHFEEIGSGDIGGPGQSLIWAIRYLVRALTGSNKGATLAAAPFFWLRYLDRLCRRDYAADAANGVYFLGRRSTLALAPRDMIAYYPGPR
jgi:SAM-dependent methyltransferase